MSSSPPNSSVENSCLFFFPCSDSLLVAIVAPVPHLVVDHRPTSRATASTMDDSEVVVEVPLRHGRCRARGGLRATRISPN